MSMVETLCYILASNTNRGHCMDLNGFNDINGRGLFSSGRGRVSLFGTLASQKPLYVSVSTTYTSTTSKFIMQCKKKNCILSFTIRGASDHFITFILLYKFHIAAFSHGVATVQL